MTEPATIPAMLPEKQQGFELFQQVTPHSANASITTFYCTNIKQIKL